MRVWIARLLIGVVTAWNVQAALSFMIDPAAFTPGFELSGVPGAAAVRGVGILFLMWNVPYGAALWQPVQNRFVLGLACMMQAVGVIGESYVWSTLPFEHFILRASLLRFITFDAIGFILLLIALWVVTRQEAA